MSDDARQPRCPGDGLVEVDGIGISGRIRVRFLRVVRGAFLSQIDLEARGFRDPGGEITTTTQGNTTMQTVRPPQMPGRLTLRTAAGLDLLPEVSPGPVSHGVVRTSIGFKAPPGGTVMTLTIDNYILQDRPAPSGTTWGHWSVTFRMP